MPRTRSDLVTEAADLLNVSQVGQALSEDDAALIDRKIDTVLARLASRNVLYLQDDQAIEDEFFDPLAVILANNVGPKFGQSFDQGTDDAQEALLRQMQILVKRRASSVQRVEYF